MGAGELLLQYGQDLTACTGNHGRLFPVLSDSITRSSLFLFQISETVKFVAHLSLF